MSLLQLFDLWTLELIYYQSIDIFNLAEGHLIVCLIMQLGYDLNQLLVELFNAHSLLGRTLSH